MTAGAELGPSERLRSRADAVNSMAFDAIKPRRVRASRDVPAAPEKLERPTMTLAAHLERRGCIRSCDEITSVSFVLFRLRRIGAVATIAPDTRAAVCAGFIDRNNLTLQPAVAIDAVILALGGDGNRSAKEPCAGQSQPDPENHQR